MSVSVDRKRPALKDVKNVHGVTSKRTDHGHEVSKRQIKPQDIQKALKEAKESIESALTQAKVSSPKELDGFSNKRLFGLDQAYLPALNSDNDLRDQLEAIVLQGSEPDIFVLDSVALSRLFINEIRRCGVSQRCLADRMQLNSGVFSTFFVNRIKSFSMAPMNQKMAYYHAFWWLNLSLRDRLAFFYPMLESSIYQPRPEHIPALSTLVSSVKKELTRSGISVEDLSSSFLMVPAQVIQDLLHTTLLWDLLPKWMQEIYSQLWFWLQQTQNNRIAMTTWKCNPEIIMKPSAYPDTWLICQAAKSYLQDDNISFEIFCAKILNVTPNMAQLLMDHPVEWSELENPAYEKVYVSLLRWISQPREKRSAKMRHKVKKEKQNDDNKAVAQQTLPEFEPPILAPNEDLDTFAICRQMKHYMSHTKSTLRKLLPTFQVNRNYFSSLLRRPVPWLKCNTFQKSIYSKMQAFIANPTQLIDSCPPAEEVKEAPFHQTKRRGPDRVPRYRARFSQEQKAMLHEAFARNPRPSADAKRQLAEATGLELRTVAIFFNNKRRQQVLRAQQRQPSQKESNTMLVTEIVLPATE